MPTERKVQGMSVQRRSTAIQASPSWPRSSAATAMPNGTTMPT